jgi:hypothetical protein
VGFLGVLTGTTYMIAESGYNDKISHTLFVLHATNGFLLLARAAFKSDEPTAVG